MAKVETSRAKVLARLLDDGWTLDRHGREHDLYHHPKKPGFISLPRHRVLTPGVARSISKAAAWH